MGLGSSNSAQKQAAADEAKKQADISAAITGINQIYDDPSRQNQYNQLATDTTKYYTDDVNRQEAVAARKQKFALARQGLSGGSEQAYQGKVLGQDYTQAIIDATRKGQQAKASLQAADESSRENMIAMAEAGLSAGDASNQATRSLQTNLLSNQGSATADSLGNVFGDLASSYQQSQDIKAARQGQIYGYGGLFSNPNPQQNNMASNWWGGQS